ncbi:MAG: cytochrome c oxidase subunit II [Methylobacter sp.]
MDSPLNYLHSSGPAAEPITRLGWGLTAISLLVTVIIAALLLTAIFKRRQKAPLDDQGHAPITREPGGMLWIYIGVGISTVVLFASALWTIFTIAAVTSPSRTPTLTINVTARQWWWEVRYRSDEPALVFTTANEIHIPTGEPVRINLVAADVIHSFWVPQLAGKMDVIPGQNNSTWIQADKSGDYFGQCGEYCGAQHAHMAFHVVAQTPDEFAVWRRQQLAATGAPQNEILQQGQDVFMTHCSVCHAVRGTVAGGNLGPDLTHMASRSTIAAGLLANNPDNAAAWINDAQALKPGSSMPSLHLSTQELTNVVAYLGSLK